MHEPDLRRMRPALKLTKDRKPAAAEFRAAERTRVACQRNLGLSDEAVPRSVGTACFLPPRASDRCGPGTKLSDEVRLSLATPAKSPRPGRRMTT